MAQIAKTCSYVAGTRAETSMSLCPCVQAFGLFDILI